MVDYCEKTYELLSPMYDFVFKYVFGDERNEDLLKSLLSSILNTEIDDITYLPSELNREHEDGKLGILDLRLKVKGGVDIDVEVQVAKQNNYIKRSYYYSTRITSKQLKKGDKSYDISKVICINILNFTIPIFNNLPHAVITSFEKNTGQHIDGLFELHFLQLELIDKLNNPKLIDWMKLFKFEDTEELRMIAESNNDIKKALEEIEKISNDPVLRDKYEDREKMYRDHINIIETAEMDGAKKYAIKLVERALSRNSLVSTEELFDLANVDEVYLSIDEIETIRKNLS